MNLKLIFGKMMFRAKHIERLQQKQEELDAQKEALTLKIEASRVKLQKLAEQLSGTSANLSHDLKDSALESPKTSKRFSRASVREASAEREARIRKIFYKSPTRWFLMREIQSTLGGTRAQIQFVLKKLLKEKWLTKSGYASYTKYQWKGSGSRGGKRIAARVRRKARKGRRVRVATSKNRVTIRKRNGKALIGDLARERMRSMFSKQPDKLWSPPEIVSELKLTRNQTFRALRELIQDRWIKKTQDKKYRKYRHYPNVAAEDS